MGMQGTGRRSRLRRAVTAAGLGLLLTLSACGQNSAGDGDDGGSAAGGEGGTKVGVILPETDSSARWEGFDKPMLDRAMRAEGLDPDIQNAQGDEQKFSTLADGMISSGVRVLVIASISSDGGATVAEKAQAQGIPVIDYDRLNLGGTSDYYVSFDNERVGALQGEGLVQGIGDEQGAQVIEIEGAPTDNNATLFYNGQQSVLKPLYDDGSLVLAGSQTIEKWDNQVGGTTFEQLLTANGGKVDGVVAANDGLAGAVITVLAKYGLNGTVPVTGQDATADGLAAILRGDQYMTVFKPIEQEAEAAAKLAAALANGDTAAADAVATQTVRDPDGNRDVPSVLLTPEMITRDSVKKVVDAGYVSAAEICTAEAAPACGELGIS
ncbi:MULTISPECIES: sugar ABC transporter substrate-binding protein [Pseudonocardia]|uniref:D-xylose-binding periplasmic protein n=2 Tax=Pseudonocardia TaxID=1847 RepID=A0A1Y2N6T5_PSEAH|nr:MULTISPECIES: substrate-binding domain-containing protein [Pseudonocardia]OSY42891.1 D-xylose-binding periplasmic protein precursor [Pseudonocardia autotrophica]TDN77469.1 monosaccharide ABC transporter substrate-binding protein (CUT2 family) [Pseudonocardia autotrophica]BBG01491.1 sugar ABC transporter substrate-binding protein [Pseudonocardia autotrophica]GEC25275.1 sugar ABC transporter substrate-binding protein [Pseudonocardia saturnea]